MKSASPALSPSRRWSDEENPPFDLTARYGVTYLDPGESLTDDELTKFTRGTPFQHLVVLARIRELHSGKGTIADRRAPCSACPGGIRSF